MASWGEVWEATFGRDWREDVQSVPTPKVWRATAEDKARWAEACTGIAASWCPICGDCCCDREKGLNDPACPLHHPCDNGAVRPRTCKLVSVHRLLKALGFWRPRHLESLRVASNQPARTDHGRGLRVPTYVVIVEGPNGVRRSRRLCLGRSCKAGEGA